MAQKIKAILLAKRVSYGNKKTPVKDREYKLYNMPSSPVGTKTEWRKWAKEHNVRIRFKEK
jgi:hypothetical protein